ncbi:di-heme oxidoredictase family protein, partial [Vibrio parahaemolyticus]|nr:di-heme oxidoredictase family protein [Vibrio parahaemolyticus]
MKPYLISALAAILSSSAMAYDVKSGGKTSVKKDGANAYSLPAANLPMSKRLDFSVGNSFFRNPWVQAPASTDARDGLGPLINTNGCQNCHIKDGRGHPPEKDDLHAVSMLV